MQRLKRILIAATGAALWLLAFGFVMFAATVMREPTVAVRTADAIVVLTGGQTRIEEGARLLDEGRGDRLLISGVNPQIGRETVKRLSGLADRTFDCCVDIDYAPDTVGNATEANRWASQRAYQRLIIVTSSYHMPRSLAEFARAMPGTELIAHPVVPKDLRRNAWWLDATATRLIVSEYLKFLPAAAKLIASRATPWQGEAVETAASQGTKS